MANPGHAMSKAGTSRPPLPMADPPGQATSGCPTTRSSTLLISDIIKDSTEPITNAETARKFLDSMQVCIPGVSMTLELLSHALFHISLKSATPTVCSLIWATAFLTTELAVSPIISSIQKLLTLDGTNPTDSPTSSQKEELKTITEKLDTTIDQWSTQQEEMKAMLSKVPQMDGPTNLIILDAWIHSISESINSIQASIETMKTQSPATPMSQNPLPQTFHDVVANEQPPTTPRTREIPPGLDQARGHSAIKQQQLLMDPDMDHPLIKPDTPSDTLAKIFQKALELMKTDSAPPLKLQSIFRLRNQGIILELTSAEAAAWLRSPSNRLELTEKLGGKICLKDRQFNVVVPFFPISTDINSADTLRTIEEESRIQNGTISQIRWIKDPARRDRRQRVAHALVSLTTAEAANKTIDEGLYVNLEHLKPCKDKKEPICCLKCQYWGHIARDCKRTVDTCGMLRFRRFHAVAAVCPALLTLVSPFL